MTKEERARIREDREREILRVSKLMPLQPAQGALELAEERGLIGGEAIVYKADSYWDGITEMRQQGVRCRCSACGGQWFAAKLGGGCCRNGAYGIGFLNGCEQIGHGDTLLCPECGAAVKALHVSHFGAAREYRVSDCFFITVENVGGCLAVLEWWAERTVDKNALIRTAIRRHEATVVIGGKCVRFSGHMRVMNGGESWLPRWERRMKYEDRGASVKGKNLLPFDPRLVAQTDAEKSGLEDYCANVGDEDDILPAMYLQTWCAYPQVENLARTGHARFVTGLIKACLTQSSTWYIAYLRYNPKTTGLWVDWKKQKPNEILRLTKDEYRALAGESFPLITYYAQIKAQYGIRLSPELLGKVKEIGTDKLQALTKDTTHHGTYISPVRIINYAHKNQGRRGFTVRDLLDHWRILDEYYGRLPEELIFPADFEAAHLRFSALAAAKKNAGQDAAIGAAAKRMRWMAWRDDDAGLMIFPAEDTFSLTQEGKTLHHCVGTYARSVARGETAIFFIRRIDAPDEPYFTLEYKNGEVQQNRGDHNRGRTPEVAAFESAWLAHIRAIAQEQQKSERRSA